MERLFWVQSLSPLKGRTVLFMQMLLLDLKRLCSWRLVFSVLGVAFSFLFSLEYRGFHSGDSVFTLYRLSSGLSGQILTYIFCMSAFSFVFCEDLENSYIRYSVIRFNLHPYVFSKVILIYLSSMACMISGGILFVFGCTAIVPWASPKDIADGFGAWGEEEFGFLLKEKHYVLYYFISLAFLGLLAGSLSVMAAYVSLYIRNKVMAFSLPILLYQALCRFYASRWLSVSVFHLESHWFDHPLLQIIYPIWLSIVSTILVSTAIFRKVQDSL